MRELIVLVGCLVVQVVFGAKTYILSGDYLESGQDFSVTPSDSTDVYNLLGDKCHLFKSMDMCTDTMDQLNALRYGIAAYTPRHEARTMEDVTTARWDIILSLIQRYDYKRYLEIGCDKNDVFKRVRDRVPVAIGVDPVQGGTLRITSDAFFQSNTEKFDLIFIDGNHNATQVVYDVSNALDALNEGGTIVMHDCNPRVEIRQIPTQHPTTHYNGDVWKVALLLRLVPDIEVIIIDIDHGVGVVRKRPNLYPLPTEFEQVLFNTENPLEAFTYADLEASREVFLRLIPVAGFRKWLDEV